MITPHQNVSQSFCCRCGTTRWLRCGVEKIAAPCSCYEIIQALQPISTAMTAKLKEGQKLKKQCTM